MYCKVISPCFKAIMCRCYVMLRHYIKHPSVDQNVHFLTKHYQLNHLETDYTVCQNKTKIIIDNTNMRHMLRSCNDVSLPGEIQLGAAPWWQLHVQPLRVPCD